MESMDDKLGVEINDFVSFKKIKEAKAIRKERLDKEEAEKKSKEEGDVAPTQMTSTKQNE